VSRWRALDENALGKGVFDPLIDHGLLFELKQLYVAVTRARSNLWIYDESTHGATMNELLEKQCLVTSLGESDFGDATGLAKRSTAEEWLNAGQRFMTSENYSVSSGNPLEHDTRLTVGPGNQQAVSCFVKAGDRPNAQKARAYVLVQAAIALEGVGKACDIKEAARHRSEAASLFSEIGSWRNAAGQYELAGSALSRNGLFKKAAKCWAQCAPAPSAGRALLQCLQKIGSAGYIDVIDALELSWIAKDAEYQVFREAFTFRVADDLKDSEIARLAALFPEIDEGVQFLQDQGRCAVVDILLRNKGEWERLAVFYEGTGQLPTALEYWELGHRNDRIADIKQTYLMLDDWTDLHSMILNNASNSGHPTKTSASSTRLLLNPYYKLLQSYHTCQNVQFPHSWNHIKVSLDDPRIIDAASDWNENVDRLSDFASYLQTGSFPKGYHVVDLGIYRLTNDEDLCLVTDTQIELWREPESANLSRTSQSWQAITTTKLARLIGRYTAKILVRIEEIVSSM
jgi:hypothetical protein